jgi:soluble lytic murein transglycosylase-like protein
MISIAQTQTTSSLLSLVILAAGLFTADSALGASAELQLARLATAEPRLEAGAADSHPLTTRDAILYQEVFALQEQGEWAAADALIDRLNDVTLIGHVRYQRYMHPTAYRSSYAELQGWLAKHQDHPGAERVYKLALKRQPRGAAAPARPEKGYLTGSGQRSQELIRVNYRAPEQRPAAAEAALQGWLKDLDRLGDHGRVEQAVRLFGRDELQAIADPVELDLARWAVARAHLYARRFEPALKLALQAAGRSGARVPEIHWTVGISAWHLQDIDLAATHFAALAETEGANRAERTRAAYWAARAVGFKTRRARQLLLIAAEDPRNFYGILARQRLGLALTHEATPGDLKDAVAELLLRYPGARRATALAQIGRHDLAEKEVRKLAARAKSNLTPGLIALAQSLHLPSAEMRLAHRLGYKGNVHLDALYPVPAWQPTTGFKVDRALVFAVIRAESGFDPAAESYVGARGLMQVMPGTARHIAERAGLELKSTDHLFDPETAITFGQAYLEELLGRRGIGDNLIFIAAGYNAGPGRVASWQNAFGIERDPMLFLETIPFSETRIYAKKVLANLWNYRARLGQESPSLEAMVANRWPAYQAFDGVASLHAAR